LDHELILLSTKQKGKRWQKENEVINL